MPSIWTSDRIGPMLIRQIAGFLLLAFVIILPLVNGTVSTAELAGTFGLFGMIFLALMSPPRRLAAVLRFEALACAVLGAYWMVRWGRGNLVASANGLALTAGALMGAFLSRLVRLEDLKRVDD